MKPYAKTGSWQKANRTSTSQLLARRPITAKPIALPDQPSAPIGTADFRPSQALRRACGKLCRILQSPRHRLRVDRIYRVLKRAATVKKASPGRDGSAGTAEP